MSEVSRVVINLRNVNGDENQLRLIMGKTSEVVDVAAPYIEEARRRVVFLLATAVAIHIPALAALFFVENKTLADALRTVSLCISAFAIPTALHHGYSRGRKQVTDALEAICLKERGMLACVSGDLPSAVEKFSAIAAGQDQTSQTNVRLKEPAQA